MQLITIKENVECQRLLLSRPVTSLGHQEGRRETMSNILNDVQHIFPGGAKNFLRSVSSPLRPPGYGPTTQLRNLIKIAMVPKVNIYEPW